MPLLPFPQSFGVRLDTGRIVGLAYDVEILERAGKTRTLTAIEVATAHEWYGTRAIGGREGDGGNVLGPLSRLRFGGG